MGCCASSDNTEKPSEIRPNSKREGSDEKSPENSKSTANPVNGTPAISEPQKVEIPGRRIKVPRLDMSKVLNPPQNFANKPKAVHAKPNEPNQKEEQPKPNETQPKNPTQLQQKPTNSLTNKDSVVEKNDATLDKKTTEPTKAQVSKGTLVNGDRTKEPQKQQEERKTEFEKKADPLKKAENNKNQEIEQQRREAGAQSPEIKKNPSFFKGADIKVSPDIFVSLKTGSIDNVYKAGQVLGEGAYGKVTTVTHRTTGIVRAMKSIKKKSVLKEETEKLFAEVSILKELDHPNIVKLYELFQDNDHYYLITEFCTGGELFDRIQQMQNFSEKQASEYMKQILSAVVYCHSKNIVHRDLKPENLLLDSKKPDAALKVIDFGTSSRFETGKKMTQKFGTPYYIAPEVLAKDYDEKCDVWSCGVILYILLCGYPPFNGRNDAEIMKKVKTGKFVFDDAEWSRISNDAKNLIEKMLTLDPKKRISAKEALEHPWMQKNAQTLPLNKKILDNLSTFSV